MFLNEYQLIKNGLDSLSPESRPIFEFSVIALSNLILKLSINMAKISVVLINKTITPSYLNVFTVAILF